MRDALSGVFDVADPTGTVTMNSPVWVSGWHAPLLKLAKAAINANCDNTHDLHRLVDDLFSQLQERMTTGSSSPSAFKILLEILPTTLIERRVELLSRPCRSLVFVPEHPFPATYGPSGL